MDQFVVKVAHDSRVSSVAGSIAKAVRENGKVEVRAVGAAAVNQAMKGAAKAREYLLMDGIDVIVVPSMKDIDIDGSDRTAMVLSIEPR